MSSTIEIHPIDGFVLSILVLFLGMTLTRKIPILSKYNIPPAVSGGIVCSLVLTVISVAFDVRFIFDMQVRDFLLLVFFSCIGLGAKLGHLKSGGKALATLVVVAAVLLVLQDVVGVSITLLFGKHPVYGVIGGLAA